jgi:hypothetical protein
MDPKLCNASPEGIGHGGEYGKIGFCPCGEFVSHEVNKPCTLIETVDSNKVYTRPDTCQCKPTNCPCGEFLSHNVNEPCTGFSA